MCILCGELIMHVHWTDQLAHNAEYKGQVMVGEGQRERMRSRLKRAKLSDRILNYYGLSLREWGGSRFVMADKKGNSKIVYDVGDMWQEAQNMAAKKIDPLDANFLEYLKAAAEGSS